MFEYARTPAEALQGQAPFGAYRELGHCLFDNRVSGFRYGLLEVTEQSGHVPEPRSGWANGECPKLGTLLLGDVGFNLYLRLTHFLMGAVPDFTISDHRLGRHNWVAFFI